MSKCTNEYSLFRDDRNASQVAYELYESVKDMPITSPHGHVPVEWFVSNYQFPNPTALFITPDHYVTRLMHAHGVPLNILGVGQRESYSWQPKRAFELFGQLYPQFAGTPMRWWFEDSLRRVFDIHEEFGPDSAGHIYDEIDDLLRQPEFGTRSLINRFNIDFISTTDDPIDDLSQHDYVNADSSFGPRLAPAFRPDKYLEPERSDWGTSVAALGEVSDIGVEEYEGFVEAMRRRRQYFKAHGAVLSDHSHADVGSERLSDETVRLYYHRAMTHDLDHDGCTKLRRHLFNDQARLASEDGLVLTVHPAVYRDYDSVGLNKFGHNIGADIPARAEFSRGLHAILNEYGDNPDFHCVAFTMDETTFSRSLAPLAGYYPSMYVGAPWWFLDQPEAMLRFYEDVIPICGFGKLSGFVDDTRALCSIPARHDMHRRVAAVYIGRLVCDKRISMEEGISIITDLVREQPRRVFGILRNKKDCQQLLA